MAYRGEKKREYQRQWIAARRDAWIKANGPCKCGSEENLEVDHIDPSTKVLQPREIWSRRQEVRDAELAKCQVLCSSCHSKKTVKELIARTGGAKHGTETMYGYGCRCSSCVKGRSVRKRAYRANRKALGLPYY